MKKHFFRRWYIVTMLLLCSSQAVKADIDAGEDPDIPTPFDGFSVLVAAGVMYGGKKAYEFRRNTAGKRDH